MTFLTLWMLWLLPLALIPILLHLLTLQRLRTVELPTFRFLFDTYVQQRRRMQFLEALLAFLRMLFILLLIVLFAGLVFEDWDAFFGGSSKGAGGREVILLIDASASMNAKTGGLSAFERAKRAAIDVIDELTPDDRVTVVRVSARSEELLSRFNTDTQGIKAKIENLELGSSRANLFQTMLHLFGPDAPKRQSPMLILFTDCQANSWKEAKNQGLEKLLPAGTSFTVVNVGPKEAAANFALVGDAPRRNRAMVGLPTLLTPRVVNYGKNDVEVTLDVHIDDKKLAHATRTLIVKPQSAETFTTAYTPIKAGLERGRFSLSARTRDDFPDDDHFDFVLSVQPKMVVLLVNGNVDADEMKDEAHYLQVALTSKSAPPVVDKKDGPTPREMQQAIEVRPLAQLALTAKALEEASVVILANCGGLGDAQYGLLRTFVREGGGLLILPGDKVVPQTYNASFFPVPGPQNERLTDAKLATPVGDVEKVETFAGIEFDVGHPALTVFDAPKAQHFKTVLVYKRYGLEMPKDARNARLVAVFGGTRQPALIESNLGDGKVMLAAFPFHPRWGNLPFKPDFVPLMLRLVGHLEHRPEADVQSVVVADGLAEVSVTAAWEPAEVTIEQPGGGGRSSPKLERSGARLLGVFDKTAKRGTYHVTAQTKRVELQKATTMGFAVNLAPEESDFTLVGEKEIKAMLPPGVELTFIDAAERDQKTKASKGKDRDLWGFLIVLVLVVIAGEFMLATAGGLKRKEEGPTAGERVMDVATGAWVGRMTGAGDKEA